MDGSFDVLQIHASRGVTHALLFGRHVLQEARLPFLVIDSLVVFGLHRWEGQLKEKRAREEEVAMHRQDVKHETEKRSRQYEKAAERAQKKANDKKMHNTTTKNANFAPTNHIQQPDRNKKSM